MLSFDKERKGYTNNNIALEVSRLESWLSMNPDVWDRFERYSMDEVKAGRKFGGQAIAERVRWLDLVDKEGKPAHIPNEAVAWLSRRLVAKHPEAKSYIKLRRSKFDGVVFDA